MLFNYKKLILLLFLFVLTNCGKPQTNEFSNSIINTSHLDFLYEDIKVNGREMAIIHIYSNYPGYEWIGDDDEGIACVDDAARAAVFYLKHHQYTKSDESLRKAKNLFEFLLYMQADNGFFYNFIWEDHSINKDFKTSVAEPNWWSWRAVWALMEGYNYYKNNNAEFSKRIFKSVEKSVDAIKKNIPQKFETKNVDGFIRPAWLPYETASDQTAILLLGLLSCYQTTNDHEILEYINRLIEGILLMQEGDENSFPYGAFLSWENLWHGWGNLQSYALLKASDVLKDKEIQKSALKEIDNFYQYLFENNYWIEFKIKKNENEIIGYEYKKYSQIAYMIRPMIYACITAYEITGDSIYAVKAGRILTWFFGNNEAFQQMYFPESGKCFDGIQNADEINKNSGAESTIEALMSILAVEENPIAKEELMKYIDKEIEIK